jgi:hypothetical protein
MDFTAIIKTVAPWLGTALGSPLGGLAVEAATKALGLSENTTDALKTAISGATPEQMLALKSADQAFALQMQALGFKQASDLEAIAAGDRKDARAMLISTRSMMPALLTVIVTTGFLGLLVGMMSGWLKATDSQAMLIMLGALGAEFGAACKFWFGTTANSGRKDEMLAQSTPSK